MKLFDSHCHLDDRAFDRDLPDVITRMKAAEIAAIMIAGINLKSTRKAVALAESHPGFYASVGIHPHDAKACSETTLNHLYKLAQSPKVRAWGEMGLDFNRMFSPRENQEACFFRQLEMADELNLPMIFHERDSKGRFAEILTTTHKPERKGVIHCFSGNKTELLTYLELGYYIGITGILTIKTRGAELRNLVKLIPRNRIVIETDAPYLTPAPEKNQHRRNEPAFVRSVLLKLAEVREESPESLAQVLWENTCRLFHIQDPDYESY